MVTTVSCFAIDNDDSSRPIEGSNDLCVYETDGEKEINKNKPRKTLSYIHLHS